MQLTQKVEQAWGQVAKSHWIWSELTKSRKSTIIYSSLIRSRDDAIHYLGWEYQVVNPVSLRQIRREAQSHYPTNEAKWNVRFGYLA